MVALDTNVLIRFIVKDNIVQYGLAAGLIYDAKASGQRVLATMLVVLESEWVLRSAYRYSKNQILSARLLGCSTIFTFDKRASKLADCSF